MMPHHAISIKAVGMLRSATASLILNSKQQQKDANTSVYLFVLSKNPWTFRMSYYKLNGMPSNVCVLRFPPNNLRLFYIIIISRAMNKPQCKPHKFVCNPSSGNINLHIASIRLIRAFSMWMVTPMSVNVCSHAG